jgi:3'(2'), 5'-bisphosphate nucleotidase
MQVFEREAAIRRVVQECGLQARRMAVQGFEVNQKGPGDFVTDVDRALDRELALRFAELFPQDGIITEENPASCERYQHNPQGRLWCIDPIDGTHDFIKTQKDYAVMVGLLENGQPRVGWIFDPADDVMYFGGGDWGLFCQRGDQVQNFWPQPPTLINRVVIGVRDQMNHAAALQAAIPEIDLWERPGSFGLKIVSVILGQAGLLVYFNQRVKLWDTVAPVALALQAGLTCCDLEGKPLSYEPAAIDVESLAHRQPIIIGWQHCIDILRPRIAQAMAAPQQS